MTLIAYLGDEKLKEDFLREIKWHQDQDRIIKGTYGENSDQDDFRGSAAESAAYIEMSDKLIELIQQAPQHK